MKMLYDFRYREMIDWLGKPFRSVPRQPLPPLRVSISRKVKDVVEAKYTSSGAIKGKYIVIHGIKSDSKASMQSMGDPDSLLPIEIWDEIASSVRYMHAFSLLIKLFFHLFFMEVD